ncbi:MAG: AraC family transcriptional regulator [Bacteroidetes bacterium]|nr:AraC family transcriptional regulator [Bacteroidota bacterium]
MTVIIGIILAIFLSIILLSKKNKSLSDKILLAWLTTIAITLILFNLQTEEARYNYPLLLGWGFPFPLLQWPFLYLYVLSLTSREPLTARLLLHFSPFILSILLFSKYLFLPDQIKIDIYNKHGEGYETQMAINLIAIILSAVIYTTLASYEIWKYKQNIQNEFSFTGKITLNWLLYLIIAMTCILLLVLFRANDDIIYSSVTGVVLYIGYFGIKQVGIFSEKMKTGESSLPEGDFKFDQQLIGQHVYSSGSFEHSVITETKPRMEKVKYEKTKLSTGEVTSIHKRLEELMNEEKLFKNPELTLSELARRIPIHPNALSQVINTVENKNFYDYVNGKRVEEFQRIVISPKRDKYTLLSLAFESGFNSKTSFNRNFKKVTNLSPSEFLKQKNINLMD